MTNKLAPLPGTHGLGEENYNVQIASEWNTVRLRQRLYTFTGRTQKTVMVSAFLGTGEGEMKIRSCV